jgi:predicted nuclease of restriction endonuclease-like (RecB) superfamily
LSWTHYRYLLRVESTEAASGTCTKPPRRTGVRARWRRQIGTLYYERLLLSQDKAGVEAEADEKLAALPQLRANLCVTR